MQLHSRQGRGVQIVAEQSLHLEDVMDCTSVARCSFTSKQFDVTGFRCPIGTGVSAILNAAVRGCLDCTEGYTQVIESCQRCPDQASQCFASHFRMDNGAMVQNDEYQPQLPLP